VLIVAVGALDQALVHAMMEGLGELGLDFRVARVAERRLAIHQQVLTLLGMVRRVTVNAAHVVEVVLGTSEVAMFFAVFVAPQARRALLRGGDVVEGEHVAHALAATRIHVRLPGAVTRLAARGEGCAPHLCVRVDGRRHLLTLVFMAGDAGFLAGIIAGLAPYRSRPSRCGMLRLLYSWGDAGSQQYDGGQKGRLDQRSEIAFSSCHEANLPVPESRALGIGQAVETKHLRCQHVSGILHCRVPRRAFLPGSTGVCIDPSVAFEGFRNLAQIMPRCCESQPLGAKNSTKHIGNVLLAVEE